ncbi:MAG TPA: hypothetical protein VFN35_23645 [Ktedonobacteraceae bacterium]|nr:hypothetical protein [Ktedonobacteraceae bacterium]
MTNPQTHSEETLARTNTVETLPTDAEALALQGFNGDEIMSLLWLHQWYQNGGSDRIEVLRRLEFLKQMVLQGRIEL